MRGLKALAGGTALVAALVAAAGPSHAQSLLQRLFGFGVERLQELRFGRMGPSGYGSDYQGGGWEEDFGTYRTLCVRTCDGFYFPISDGVRRERLYADSRSCMQRCDGEARLYYYPTDRGSVETMVDLSGRRYADLPTAFRYRKALVEGCACKPAPWSAEAAVRHQGYAAETAARGGAPEVDDGRDLPRRTARSAQRDIEPDPYPYEDEAPRTYRPWMQTPWDRGRRGWGRD
jgi:hypothetical protein